MKLHREELELALAYGRSRRFEELNTRQLREIRERGRRLYRWFKAHQRFHNLVNAAVVALILAGDAYSILGLPRLILTGDRSHHLGWIIAAGVSAGFLHGWLMYSLTVLSLHEGAAHNLVFTGTGIVARAGRFLARNLCRLQHGEPDYYAACHMAHHAKFGTAQDSEFLNYVMPRRFWATLLPLAAFINSIDFVIHRPPSYTRSRAISTVLSLLYHGIFAWLAYRTIGLAYTLFLMLVWVPHFGFYLDRLRQFTEHNLMPLENQNGARSLGIGFWGLLIGGGPWGQPCHLAHHLVPAVPWYQQIVLHFYIKGLMTERQRAQFLVAPVIGFPRMLWKVIFEANAFARMRGAFGADVRPVEAHRS